MDITVQELKERMDKNETPMLIDVRENWEHEEFNIGGKLIPVGQLMESIPDIEDYRENEIVLYCRSGNRSGIATQMLKQAGFSNPRNLVGGMLAWQKEYQD